MDIEDDLSDDDDVLMPPQAPPFHTLLDKPSVALFLKEQVDEGVYVFMCENSLLIADIEGAVTYAQARHPNQEVRCFNLSEAYVQ